MVGAWRTSGSTSSLRATKMRRRLARGSASSESLSPAPLRCLRPPHRMRAVGGAIEPGALDPVMDDPHILSRRQVRLRPKAAREDVVSIPRVDPGKPVLDRRPGLLGDFKLHRPACLLLDYSGAVSNPSAGANIERRPKDVIHHSDQGSQYTSVAFGKRCGKAGVRPSMGSVGDAYDNAAGRTPLLSTMSLAGQVMVKSAPASSVCSRRSPPARPARCWRSRLARNGRDWHTLLEFCAFVNSLIIADNAGRWPWAVLVIENHARC